MSDLSPLSSHNFYEVTLDVILESVRKNQNRLTKYFLEHTDVILGKINQSKAKRVVLEVTDLRCVCLT